MRHPSTVAAVFLLGLALVMASAPARAADRTIAITGLSAFPAQSPGGVNKLAGLRWPEVKSLSLEVKLETAGYEGEQKVDLFLVLLDEQDEVVQKLRQKHLLKPGKHSLVVSDFMSTNLVFGEHTLALKAEAALKGANSARSSIKLTVAGPEPPHVDILQLEIYSPTQGRDSTRFDPGDEFAFSALIDVGKNESEARPRLRIYTQMEEEEYYGLDPDSPEQDYTQHWDEVVLPAADGVFEVTATGHLPYYFSQPWDFHHSFRIWALVSFGDGRWHKDYARAKLFDQASGDDRRSDKVEERLITLNRGYTWDVRHLRNARED